jgi:hypothetical protein
MQLEFARHDRRESPVHLVVADDTKILVSCQFRICCGISVVTAVVAGLEWAVVAVYGPYRIGNQFFGAQENQP